MFAVLGCESRLKRSLLTACAALILAAVGSAEAAPPQGWDKLIPSGASRFKVLSQFGGEAVLDKETGLTWQRSPSPTNLFDWGSSAALCIGTAVGGRRGWRLPSGWELMTLKDPGQSNPALPPGHPFQDVVESTIYWTSTASLVNASSALALTFSNGAAGVITTTKTGLGLRWCLRGPGGDYPGTP